MRQQSRGGQQSYAERDLRHHQDSLEVENRAARRGACGGDERVGLSAAMDRGQHTGQDRGDTANQEREAEHGPIDLHPA